ncbi:MAG: hypothetical protein ACF8XB_07080 [Planctomycetota bacterium JB042]
MSISRTTRSGGRIGRAMALALPLLAGCATWSEQTVEARARYAAGEFAAAEGEIDRLFARETDVDPAVLEHPGLLARDPDAAEGNGVLLLLEKGMARLGGGDADGAIDLFRRARDELDSRYRNDVLDFVGAAVLDDAWLDYPGADSDHLLVRVLLCLSDLLLGGGDAVPYAFQIGAKQEEILGSEFGVEQGYAPRQQYRRLAIGAYLEGVLSERTLDLGGAERAYRRALEYAGESRLIAAAVERASTGVPVSAGRGVVHVFRLVGRGPVLVEGVAAPTTLATRLAGLAVTLVTDRGAALAQAPVKVPVVSVTDAAVPSAPIAVDGKPVAGTETILDVNRVATEQLEANLPWTIARALIRRTLKATVASYLESHLDRRNKGEVAFVTAAALNFLSTAAERADTRSWSSLPAELQAARLELLPGERTLAVAGAPPVTVRITPGHESFVLVLQTDPRREGVAFVDVTSRVEPPRP